MRLKMKIEVIENENGKGFYFSGNGGSNIPCDGFTGGSGGGVMYISGCKPTIRKTLGIINSVKIQKDYITTFERLRAPSSGEIQIMKAKMMAEDSGESSGFKLWKWLFGRK